MTNPQESSFELQCDPPNDDIYHFHGRLLLLTSTNVYPYDNNNLLLRCCVLRITDYVDGIIVYAGNQTKLIRSSRNTSRKTALIERYINRDVLFSSLILIFLCLLGTGLSVRWGRLFGEVWSWIPFILDDPFENVGRLFFALTLHFLILFQVMILIALYVSLDIVRILQMYTTARDKNFKFEHTISCRTFTINEDLGQICYIFSNKTSTLTQNKLEFKAMSIGGLQFSNRSELADDNNPLVRYFLTTLAFCNTSFIAHEYRELMHRLDYEPKYEGDNADDLVLCQTTSRFGLRIYFQLLQPCYLVLLSNASTIPQSIR